VNTLFENDSNSSATRDFRRQSIWKLGVSLAAIAALSIAIPRQALAQTYNVTQVDNLGIARAINASGQVCINENNRHAFLWTPTTPNGTIGTKLALPPLPFSLIKPIYGYSSPNPVAINSSGTVAGDTESVYYSPYKVTFKATVWKNGQAAALPGAGFSSGAAGINTIGDVVGANGGTGAWWHNGIVTALSTPNGSQSLANSINDAGQIVGWTANASGLQHATLWQNGKAFDLGVLSGGASGDRYATGINNAGVVIGSSAAVDSTGAKVFHAFIWTPAQPNGTSGKMVDITTNPGLSDCEGLSINSGGQVVGTYELSDGTGGAFVWDHLHGMRDLDSLLPAGSGWSLWGASGINDKGQIVGDGNLGAFLLTP
jgi:probable HAF family extracellular repeat protein